MSDKRSSVELFVSLVRKRLNGHRMWNALIWSLAIGALAKLVYALSFVMRGYSVPPVHLLIIGLTAFSIGQFIFLFRRADQFRAARFADDFFGLEDSLVSYCHFAEAGKHGGFYDLQAKQTSARITKLSPTQVKYRIPYRVAATALVLTVCVVLLGFKSPSKAVQERLAQEEQTFVETQKINVLLEEMVEELEKTATTDEREELELDKIRQWVGELKETKDQKEALRQYARLEQKLASASSRLQQKRDEQLLDRAADELGKDRETRDLAETLKQKKYEEAIEELRELEPEKKDELTEQRRELARLKAAANRMATAARSMSQDKKGDHKRQLQRLRKSRDSKSASAADADDDVAEGDLDDELEELEDAAQDWEDSLSELELSEAELGDADKLKLEECEVCRLRAIDELDDIEKKLARLAIKRRAQGKLARLARVCSQGQAALTRTILDEKNVGAGTHHVQREERDELIDNGQFTELKGTPGEGPSVATVEAAEDGDGVASRRHTAVQRNFQRQVESFVQREDVPEDVKAGVKEYFKNIHQVAESKAGPTEGE